MPATKAAIMDQIELKNKRILAIDYGRKFTGMATLRYGVDPFVLMNGRISYESDRQLATSLKAIVEEEFIDMLVVGVPFFTDGKASKMTETVRAFIDEAKSLLDIPVFEIDETLTTFEAQERMKEDPRFNFKVDLLQIDAMSAVIILEEFLKNFSDS